MSQTAARAFIERMKTDEAFKTKIMAVSDLDARIKLIHAEGFDCTAEDIGMLAAEISDESLLAGLTGGGNLGCPGHVSCEIRGVCLGR